MHSYTDYGWLRGFHAWFNADGSLREGLECLRELPVRRAPWEKSTWKP